MFAFIVKILSSYLLKVVPPVNVSMYLLLINITPFSADFIACEKPSVTRCPRTWVDGVRGTVITGGSCHWLKSSWPGVPRVGGPTQDNTRLSVEKDYHRLLLTIEEDFFWFPKTQHSLCEGKLFLSCYLFFKILFRILLKFL